MANLNVVNEFLIQSENRYITAGDPLSLKSRNALQGDVVRTATWRFIHTSKRHVYKIFNPATNRYLQFVEEGNVAMVDDPTMSRTQFLLSNGIGTHTKISEDISCNCQNPTPNWLSFDGNEVVYVQVEREGKNWNLEPVGQ